MEVETGEEEEDEGGFDTGAGMVVVGISLSFVRLSRGKRTAVDKSRAPRWIALRSNLVWLATESMYLLRIAYAAYTGIALGMT